MVSPWDRLRNCTGFDWDEGNSTKNWESHEVSQSECEQVFLNRPLFVKRDRPHSKFESRYFALGRTDVDRRLFVAFTIRGERVRVFSARDMTDGERIRYAP